MVRTVRTKANRKDELRLDSTHLIAFDMAHTALRTGLASASTLNIIQFHTLIKVFTTGTMGLSQTDLCVCLDLKPNVVSLAVQVLEEAGLISRTKGDDGDGRVKVVRITDAGCDHTAVVNVCIIEQLYTIFPTQNKLFRSILEASIAAGANIDPPASEDIVRRFLASRALVSLELIRRTFETMLRNLAGVSFNEYRILQRLSEVGTPLRSVDLVHQLCLSPATVARSADRLVKYDWAARLSDPKDRKAVFIAATEAGLKKQKTLGDSIDSLARNYLWKNLNQAQRHVIAQVGHVVIARLQEQEEAERIAALSLLQPID